MDLLSTGREYNTRTGAHFTVRSANSVSYSLTRRPLWDSRYQKAEEEAEKKDRSGTQTDLSEKKRAESSLHYQARACNGVKGQSLVIKQNQNTTKDKITEFVADQMRSSERQGRTEWRKPSVSTRSKSLDWRTGAKSPERRQSYKADIQTSKTKDTRGPEGNWVMSTVQAYNAANISYDQGMTPSRSGRGQSLPSRLRSQSASLGPKAGQSILERIEKLYGCSEFGNTDDNYKKVEQPSQHTGSFGGTFPRCFSSGECRQQSGEPLTWTTLNPFHAGVSATPGISRTRLPSGQWQKERQVNEGNVFLSKGLPDIGTRSLDRARSRSTIAAKIRATRTAEEMTKPAQSNTVLEGISEVGLGTEESRTNTNWNRISMKEVNTVKKEHAEHQENDIHRQLRMKRESSSDDVFESNLQKFQLKSTEKKPINDKTSKSAASVRNKINQFEALTQRAQTNAPRRAFSVPGHISTGYEGVQRSSSAKAIGSVKCRWDKTFGLERNEKLDQDKLSKKEINLSASSVDENRLNKVRGGPDKELQNNKYSEAFDKYSKLRTTLELPLNKDLSPVTLNNFDEADFSKIGSPVEVRNKDTSSTSAASYSGSFIGEKILNGSGYSTPVSDDDKTPTNTPDNSPFLSPISHQQKSPPSALPKNESNSAINEETNISINDSVNMSPPLSRNLPDLVSDDFTNGKKRILDLNAWLDGLNPQIKVWGDDEDDDESTQKDEDSNYDSDSGESSVTVTSNMSNKSFSVSLADLCNFAGVEYESENDSDEWQSMGRRSASLSSDVSGFSYVSVLPTEELDKLIEDVRSIGDNNLQDYEDVHVVVLHKDIGVGLGFSLAGGVDQNKPVTVHKIFYSGVAAKEGSIREGDQVLSINGTALSGFAHWEALRVLRRAKGREMGVVVLRKPNISGQSNRGVVTVNQAPAPTQVTETGQRITVNLEKTNRDLGFSLEGGVGSSLGNKPLTVQKIFQGGPVDKIAPGDEVLEINGVTVVGMRRLEAWTLIRKLPTGPVIVVLRRPQPHQT